MKPLIAPPAPPARTPVAPARAAPSTGIDVVDLKQYLHIVVKRIWLVALCFVISVSIMFVILTRQVPVYSCRATVLLSQGLPVPSRFRQTETELWGDYIETQRQIMQSALVMDRARERLGRPTEEIEKAVTRIWIDQIFKTSLIGITVDSTDPVLGADLANAIAEEYVAFKAEERMDTSQATVVSLTQQANRLREELKKAEERVLLFEKENKVVAIEERGNIAANYLAQLSGRAASFRTERMLLEAQQPLISQASDEIVLATLASPGPPWLAYGVNSLGLAGDTSAVPREAVGAQALLERGLIAEPAWQSLRREKAKIEAELAELRTRFRDAHPAVQAALARLKAVQRELDVELQFALKQYYSELEALAIKEQAARRVEMEWEDEALEVARKSHEYQNLKQNVARLQGLYDVIFNRLKEVDVSIGIEPESVRILERAVPASRPTTPRRLQSLFMAAVIGLGIGLGLVFALEYLDDSLRYPEEVTEGLGLPFFGVIPSARWDPEDLRSHLLSNLDQRSGLAEAYRNVRSALLFTAPQEYVKSIVVTSAVPLEGKTTTCLNVAVSLAQAGHRVLVVDGDLRRGTLHKFFGLEAGRGFSDLLSGQAKPEAVIQRTGIPNLDLVATGPFPPNPAELILRPELAAFLDYAKRTYDRILFDCPPVMVVSEAGILCSLVDGVIFVVWAGQTSRKVSHLAVQTLRERGANILGCVLNNLEFGRVGYYYYSTYYGYYDYDYRYGQREREIAPSGAS